MRFTSSWDDGHPLDLRVAELLARHGFQGTFYVPRTNSEGRPVLSTSQLRSLAAGFEIGGHTLDHVRLHRVSMSEAWRQVVVGKQRIEDELGRPIVGFCYPGGNHDPRIRRIVRVAGFRYARTVASFHVEAPRDAYRLGTTIQLYPHSPTTHLKNFVSHGQWGARLSAFRHTLRAPSFRRLLESLLEAAHETEGVFHLWGHSWELEEYGLWRTLDDLLKTAKDFVNSDQRIDNERLCLSDES